MRFRNSTGVHEREDGGRCRTFVLSVLLTATALYAQTGCTALPQPPRTIHAHVVALEQPIVYNRFGSMNPYGMVYALKHDVVNKADGLPMNEHSRPGQVRLADGKRPRPLVLRANPGDRLVVHFSNMLSPEQPDLSSTHWPAPYTNLNEEETPDADEPESPAPSIVGNAARQGCGSEQAVKPAPTPVDRRTDWPRTRCATITISGLTPAGNGFDPAVTGLGGIPPGHTFTYQWNIPGTAEPSTHLFFSNAAPAGGEGDGGSLVHGLFGALHVEPRNSRWYRSETTPADLALARTQHRDSAFLSYEAVRQDGTPILNMVKQQGPTDYELVYGNLNAIIVDHKLPESPAFREFTAIFHDELKTFYRDEFTALETEFTLSGVRDGFGINYGASGMGTILLANRLGMGPAKRCVECAYEEFFLESWANGDPALLAAYADDPSNVHHSYLNDRVEFRNLHAGPKETHVFHLHAHQWLAQQNSQTGTYLDSQTIAPQQGFVYPIYYGGSGNRNRAPGDSIFHCHLYPHFAQGMWELWRVHDVLEDGARRLPDGELGPGTDPLTGATDPASGTPIPAIIPLPGQAMPPAPAYGPDKNPGFPFFIPGTAGHRAPQPPMDLVQDGGLRRHVVKDGTRTVSHVPHTQAATLAPRELVRRALATGDMSTALETAQLTLLPNDGTTLERAAMAFHADPNGHASRTPEGLPATYRVNGRAPQPGAPFADPCDAQVAKLAGEVDEQGRLYERTYKVSAIDVDLVVNKDGWHDPQGRINVLDEDVPAYTGRDGRTKVKTDQAKPFFFRANSGECIRFEHTNRTSHELELDDFQVRTPTDTIGQHIHLVKFDVMSSDGSGNGWNYEDGTFAQGAIRERIEATHRPGGGVRDEGGRSITLALPRVDEYQTTVQRWFADPLMKDHHVCEAEGGVRGKPAQAPKACEDRTIRTVFTHDHFGPSSIQHHGFYSALLIEPFRSVWTKPNGDPLKSGVGTQARIIDAHDSALHPDHREFALAVADFALLYDPHRRQGEGDHQGMEHQIARAKKEVTDPMVVRQLQTHATDYWTRHGRPVDPPMLPEAISKDHHNPYLVNYRHEPIPLRIGLRDSDGSIRRQNPGLPGDMAWAFSSDIHGDPFTEIFEGYEGELAQLRVIQGAQEVQHMINLHGMRWPREIDNAKSPLVAAQEIGISEHFELKLPLSNVFRGLHFADYQYDFGAVDDLWNGAWGYVRTYNGVEAADPQQLSRTKLGNRSPQSLKTGDPLYAPIGKRLSPLPANPSGKIRLTGQQSLYDGTCPIPEHFAQLSAQGKATEVTFYIDAVSIRDWLGSDLPYDRKAGITDPDALTFVLITRLAPGDSPLSPQELDQRREQLRAHYQARLLDPAITDPIEPLVLRANAGDCMKIDLANRLPQSLRDAAGDALMPKIVPLNVDQYSSEGAQRAADVRPSPYVTLHPQLVSYNVTTYNGAATGFNGEEPVGPGQRKLYYWYAGTVSLEGDRLVHTAAELLPVNLTSWGDIINHGSHGLVGALIIEPAGATYHDPLSGARTENGGISAQITYPDSNTHASHSFREHVVLYRDGLNLHYRTAAGTTDPIPDCRVCDDSYDLGEKGFNYHSAPFQARLGQHPSANLNGALYPADFFTPTYQSISTTTYRAVPGEEVRFRVLQPHGRNRQHTFLLYGHDFLDLLPNFGSPHSPLISVGKGLTVNIRHANPGYWLYRDGPTHMWAGGMWGSFVVGQPPRRETTAQ